MGYADFLKNNETSMKASKSGLYPAGTNIAFTINSVKEIEGTSAISVKFADVTGLTISMYCNLDYFYGKKNAAELFSACGFEEWPKDINDIVGCNIIADVVHNGDYANMRNICPGGESDMSSDCPF